MPLTRGLAGMRAREYSHTVKPEHTAVKQLLVLMLTRFFLPVDRRLDRPVRQVPLC